MLFETTRGGQRDATFNDVLLSALAPDGGLYVPLSLPKLDVAEIRELAGKSYVELAEALLPRLLGSTIPENDLKALIHDAYGNFHHAAIAPMKQLDDNIWFMELFHGPTLAFKDFALQLLGRVLDYELKKQGKRAVIVGATSGDTGSAAIEACKGCATIDLYMLHPKGRVSDVQRKQMTTTYSANIRNMAVEGSFDDCQSMVKELLNDKELNQELYVTAVNSINWTRIAAQVVYYFHAALSLGAPDRSVNFSVPTGNFGNVYAGHVARSMGLPINQLIIASNRNDIITRFFETGVMEAQEVEPSLTPSMDIQISSNFERLLFELLERNGEEVAQLMTEFKETGCFEVHQSIMEKAREGFSASRVSDEKNIAEITRLYKETGEVIDPHSAIAVTAARRTLEETEENSVPIIVVGTAHPSKFPDTVMRATSIYPILPEYVSHIMELTEMMTEVTADSALLKQRILDENDQKTAAE